MADPKQEESFKVIDRRLFNTEGEIRDEATANLAVRAGLTGHLVISTLHAGSCRGVFERLLVLCADHSAVASAVELVLNQRLVRRLCSECSGSAGRDAILSTRTIIPTIYPEHR